jgi:hypothetical protein
MLRLHPLPDLVLRFTKNDEKARGSQWFEISLNEMVSAGAIIRANLSWLREAITFGMISQKRRRMKVMTTTSIMKRGSGYCSGQRCLELMMRKDDDGDIDDIIGNQEVLRSRSGLARSLSADDFLLPLPGGSSSMSLGVSEK